MAQKRKSDALEQPTLDKPSGAVLVNSKEVNVGASKSARPAAKKSRVDDASTSTSQGKGKGKAPIDWKDVKLEGEDEVRVFLFKLFTYWY